MTAHSPNHVIRLEWYTKLAEAMCFESGAKVVVLTNNSSHYLLATQDDHDQELGRVVDSYPYSPENVRSIYGQALTMMEAYALEN